MSSTWFIEFGEDDHEWHWKHNKTQLDYSICRENETASYRTSPPSVFNHVMDFHRDWRNVEEIIFLRFCQYRDDSRGVLALIVVNRSSSPVPVLCLPKTIDKDQFLRMDYFEETSAVIVTETGDGTKCDDQSIASYYSLGKECKVKREGAPMVVEDSFRVQRLIGIVANDDETPSYHIIQAYMNEMCYLMKICAREIQQIGHSPQINDEDIRNVIDDDYAEQAEEPTNDPRLSSNEPKPVEEVGWFMKFMRKVAAFIIVT